MVDVLPSIRVILLHPPGQGGAAVDKDGGQIYPEGAQDHTGDDLVTRTKKHQTVQTVGLHHHFDIVGDHLPAGEDILHSLVAHSHPVAGPDGAEFYGGSPGGVDPLLHPLGQLLKNHMARTDRIVGIHYGDNGSFQFLLAKAGGFVEGSHVCPFGTLQNVSAPGHVFCSFLSCGLRPDAR